MWAIVTWAKVRLESEYDVIQIVSVRKECNCGLIVVICSSKAFKAFFCILLSLGSLNKHEKEV